MDGEKEAKKALSEEVKGRFVRVARIPGGGERGGGRGGARGKGCTCVRACTRRLTCPLLQKKLGVYWGVVDKVSPTFELRNSGVPAVVRSSQMSASTLRRPIKSTSISSRLVTAYHWHTFMLLLANLQSGTVLTYSGVLSASPEPRGGAQPVAGMPLEIRWFGCVAG